jgi:aerobic C4-dicarboxylate transport protein
MKKIYRHLTFQVLVAIALGVLVGYAYPAVGVALKPVGDTFINLIKMVIAPIVFLTIVLGIGSMGNLRKVGRVGGKALLYFEIVTTFALLIGLVVSNLARPGDGVDVSSIKGGDISRYQQGAQQMDLGGVFHAHRTVQRGGGLCRGRHPASAAVFDPFRGGRCAHGRGRGRRCWARWKSFRRPFSTSWHMVMKLAPLGAFGGMAYSIGAFGLDTLVPLGKLMLTVYTTMFLFIFVVLNGIARYYGFSLWKYLKFIKEEILIVLGTSSSEAALPAIMQKLERFGCSRPVVGLVIPAGYSFNLDGTTIYLVMATVFLAQVFGVELSVGQQFTVVGILMVTSKGAAGVTGSGFIVLASTLSALRVVPVEGLALLLGVDRFMSEARAITNLIGNGVATIVIAKIEKEFDPVKHELALHGPPEYMEEVATER